MKELGFHTDWVIKEKKYSNYILTDDLEVHIIEIPKIYREKEEGKIVLLKQWLSFLENPESKEVIEYMKTNKGIKESKEKLELE